MPFNFNRLDISSKLLLSSLAFALPIAVLSFFMDLSFRYDILVGETELAGTAYLRKVEPILRHLPKHRTLALNAAMGDTEAAKQLPAIAKQLDEAVAALPAAQTTFLKAVSGAPTAVNDVLVRKTNPAELQRLWKELRMGGSPPLHAQVMDRTVRLIQGVADCSMLTVDPALDSAYLSDAVISQTPKAMLALNGIALLAEHIPDSMNGGPSTMDREDISSAMARFLSQGVDPIMESGRSALALDGAFYKRSPSLHTRFAPALDAYVAAAGNLVTVLTALRSGETDSMEAGTAARTALAALCEMHSIGVEELDHLVRLRIASFQRWRMLAVVFSVLAGLLAVLLTFRTWRTTAMGVGKVRRYAAAVADGDYDAVIDPPQSAELRDMAEGIDTMVARLKKNIGNLNGILHGLTVPCLVVDPEERLTFLNRHYMELYEREGKPEDFLGMTLAEFFYGEPGKETLTGRAMRENKRFRDLEVQSETAKGNTVFVRYDVAPIHDPDGKLLGAFAVIVDLTRLKEQQERILYDATHDTLTGLPNKPEFLKRVDEAAKCVEGGESKAFAVLLMDVDNFKHVNDSMGHAFGDLLIGEIGRRLMSLMRHGDTLARLGGDEFALLLHPVEDRDEVLDIAAAIHGELARPFSIGGREVFASAGVGIAIGDACGQGAEEFLRDADTAMYRAKDKGTGKSVVFDLEMHRQATQRLELETDMKNAVERHEFEPFFQPIVDLGDGSIHGFEALVRWNHPAKGLVPPGLFIPLAEENGMVVPIGSDVLEQSLARQGEWHADGFDGLTMSVNLAVPQLMRKTIVDDVDLCLKEAGVDPALVKLEITESGIMDNAEAALEAQQKLKSLGVKLSIDDFGTGYSSLSYLNRFPFDYLKVDQSFVFAMLDGDEQMEIVRTIVSLAHSLGRKVIAEGIETAEHLAALRALGCEYGQGYHFAKPLPAAEAHELLKKNPRW